MRKQSFNPKLSRRDLFKFGGLGAASLAMFALPQWVRAASALVKDSPQILIVLFQRGAADGLNISRQRTGHNAQLRDKLGSFGLLTCHLFDRIRRWDPVI